MKQTIKHLAALLTVAVLISAAVINAAAEAVFTENGYSYTYINNTTVSLCGWDNRSPAFSVPDKLAGRSVVEVGSRALMDNKVITSLSFENANSLKYIGMFAFKGCENLSGTVTVPPSVELIQTAAFEDCTSINSAVINEGIEELPGQCFSGCTSLQQVTLPQSLKTIGAYAFRNCSSLEYLEIPAGVTSIAASSFRNDANLTLGVWYGTQGYTYAKEKNIPYILLDEVLIGDVNRDDAVSIGDVTSIQRYLVDSEQLDELQLKAADVTRDGVVDMDDATKIQKYLARCFDTL